MKTTDKDETKFEDLLDEFSFTVPGVGTDANDDLEGEPNGGEDPKEGDDPKGDDLEGGDDPKDGDDLEGGDDPKDGDDLEGGDDPKGDDSEGDDPKGDDPKVKTGQPNSFYKKLALKYIEDGVWDKNLALEDEEGNQIPIEELEDLNEETFFAIQEQLNKEKEEELSKNYIPISSLDERKKNLVTIITEGGDLKDIFKSEEQVEQYLNPFGNLDLDNEAVQERVYFKSLIQYHKLDEDAAIEVVKKAKKDGTLEDKVRAFTEEYTAKFDAFVESKKQEVLKQKEQRQQELKDFGKALKEKYKEYELNDSLVSKLTRMATKETEDGFEIDSVYEQKMQDPDEAAELILFLTDKEAYLENKTKTAKKKEQIKTRKLFKLIPSQQKGGSKQTDEDENFEDDEFRFQVNIGK